MAIEFRKIILKDISKTQNWNLNFGAPKSNISPAMISFKKSTPWPMLPGYVGSHKALIMSYICHGLYHLCYYTFFLTLILFFGYYFFGLVLPLLEPTEGYMHVHVVRVVQKSQTTTKSREWGSHDSHASSWAAGKYIELL